MKRVLNFGSLNIDKVYGLKHFVRPGETVFADSCDTYCGGKGLNQSLALARCGAAVYHAGAVGGDGDVLVSMLKENGVDTTFVKIADCPSGHAIIQVEAEGQNSIIVYGGANTTITEDLADKALNGFGAGDFLLLQNEINNIPYIMTRAKEKGMRIVFNPSPVTKELLQYPLELVDILILNEGEGVGIAGETEPKNILSSLQNKLVDFFISNEGEGIAGEIEPKNILSGLRNKFPATSFVLTLGEKGSVYQSPAEEIFQPAFKAKAVDTTAAGDTFTGFFIGSITKGLSPLESLKLASRAAAIAVSRSGAAPSIPTIDEVMRMFR